MTTHASILLFESKKKIPRKKKEKKMQLFNDNGSIWGKLEEDKIKSIAGGSN